MAASPIYLVQEVLQLDIVRQGLILYQNLLRTSKAEQQELFQSSLHSGLLNPAVNYITRGILLFSLPSDILPKCIPGLLQ